MKLLFGLKSDTFSRKDICRRSFRKFLDEFHLVTGETLPRIEFTRDRATFPFPRWRTAFCCFPKFSSFPVFQVSSCELERLLAGFTIQ